MKSAQDHWNADDYAKNSSAQLQWANELIAKLALKGSEHLLDIGCGDGKITAQIAQLLPEGRVYGIDLSPDMIRLASEQYPSKTHPNLSFQHMDASDIHIAEMFDVAFSNATLHWVKNHPAVLRGIRSCIKPGGRLLFQMGGQGNAAEIFTAIRKVIDRPKWKGHYQNFTPPYHFYGLEEYETWLTKAGFVMLRAELIPKDMEHQSQDGLKGWLRTTWFPYTDCLASELRNDFLSEVVEIYIAAHPIDANGHTHVKMIRLEIEATAC